MADFGHSTATAESHNKETESRNATTAETESRNTTTTTTTDSHNITTVNVCPVFLLPNIELNRKY